MRRAFLILAALLAGTVSARADFIIAPIAYGLFAGPLGAIASFSAIYTGVQIIAATGLRGAKLYCWGAK